MSTDQRITDDLAIVARTSRARPVALETTLASVQKPTVARDASQPQTWMMIYTLRLARTCAGIALFAFIMLVVLAGYVRNELAFRTVDYLVDNSMMWFTAIAAGFATTGYALGVVLAARRMTDPAIAKRVERLWWWSGMTPIAGGVACLLLLGVWFVVHQRPLPTSAYVATERLSGLMLWRGSHPDIEGFAAESRILMVVAFAVAALGAAVIARRPTSIRWGGLAGMVLVVAAGTLTHVLGVSGATFIEYPHFAATGTKPLPLRAALMAVGTVGVLLVVSWFVLRTRRREDAILAQYAS